MRSTWMSTLHGVVPAAGAEDPCSDAAKSVKYLAMKLADRALGPQLLPRMQGAGSPRTPL